MNKTTHQTYVRSSKSFPLACQTTETDISGASCNICRSVSHRALPSGLHNEELGLRKRRSCQAAALYNSRFDKFRGWNYMPDPFISSTARNHS